MIKSVKNLLLGLGLLATPLLANSDEDAIIPPEANSLFKECSCSNSADVISLTSWSIFASGFFFGIVIIITVNVT